jgi:nucleoside-diphosphate-sugar epimerase
MSTVLVTGCSGFLGQLLVQDLLDRGFDCLGIDLQPSDLRHPRLHFLQGDIRSEIDLSHVFSKARIDAVMHVAAVLAQGKMKPRARRVQVCAAVTASLFVLLA